MSFILDALRRSERARRVLGAAEAPPAAPAPGERRRARVLVAVTLLLVANAALLAWSMLRSAPETAPAAPPSGVVRPLALEAEDPTGAASGASTPPLGAAPSAVPSATPPPADAVPLADAPPALRARLAALHVDVHGWADDPAQRFVLINLKRRVAGDALDGGAVLVEVVPDGVVIELAGQRVLLPRQ